MSDSCDLFVIGAGIAGMAAAECAVRHGLDVRLAESAMFGGLVTNVNHLAPCPQGMPTSGADLAADLMSRVTDLGVGVLMTEVHSIKRLPSGDIEITTAEDRYRARCAIVATGARLRRLDVPGEAELEHRGVSHCADCDGPFFRGQAVAVIGGGDSALQEASVLAEFCSVVHVIHRGSALSARDELVRAARSNPRISMHSGSVVDAIEGDSEVRAVTLRELRSGQSQSLPCTGVFPFVGLDANTSFLPPEIERHEGCVKVNANMETTLANVYAIGAARGGFAGELTDAIDDAARAVESVRARLAASQ